ncbi:hypothetical protein WJX73_007440 [Symbiochloris irregularis]|uniref:Arf-GAP domain-containing protein n=1 Tax=Symbiochloris irregularis TaxID=706552 RepID=A0AAW1Q2L2_9CHLO
MSTVNSKVSVTKAQTEVHKRILQGLLKLEDNRRCADCQARGPTWASVNLGVFVCLNCSGVHRSLGTHMSKVRSTTLDTWLPEQVAFVEIMGNRRANMFWEAELPHGFRRPFEGDMEGLKAFIGNKYRDHAYALRTWDKPPTIENFSQHPFMAQFLEEGAQRAVSPPPAAGQERASEQPAAMSGVSSTVARALAPPPRKAEGVPSRAATPPPEPAAPLMDLLSLDEAPTPAAPSSLAASAPAAADDGGWAAFADASVHSTGSQQQPASAPAAVEEDPWDAFQTAGSSGHADTGHMARSEALSTPAPEASTSSQTPYHAAASPPPSSPPLDLFYGLDTHAPAARSPMQSAGASPHQQIDRQRVGMGSGGLTGTPPKQLPALGGAVDLASLLTGPDPFAQSGGATSTGFANFPPPEDVTSRAQSAPAVPQHLGTPVSPPPALPPQVQAARGGHQHKTSSEDILKMFDKPQAVGGIGPSAGGFVPSMAPRFGGIPGVQGGFAAAPPANGFGMQGGFGTQHPGGGFPGTQNQAGAHNSFGSAPNLQQSLF